MAQPNEAGNSATNSLAARGGLLLFLTAVLVVGPLIFAHLWLRRAEQRLFFAAQETLLAAALAQTPAAQAARAQDGLAQTPHNENSAAPTWPEALEKTGARVYWAGLVARDGAGIELRPSNVMTCAEMAGQVHFDQREPDWRTLGTVGHAGQSLRLLTIPLRSQNAVLAALIELDADAIQSWGLLFTLLAAPVFGLALAYACFQRWILKPVLNIAQTLFAAPLELADLAAAAPSELTQLAQNAAETREELHRWRAAAQNLERALETKVDAKTRQVEKALRKAEREAETDSLTGLGNRRALQRALPQLFAEQQAKKSDLTILVFDVDHFKALNDTLGHPAGDSLLQFVGTLVRASVHDANALAVRAGGDEFVLLLPETSAAQGAALAERLAALFRQRVKTMKTPLPPPALSAGVASLRKHQPKTADELLHLADAAMYFAKRGGRAAAQADEAGGPAAQRG